MATTTYTVSTASSEGFVAQATKSSKASAIKLAETLKAEQGVAVQVTTGAGTVVFELEGKKVRKVTKPYTRIVNGVEVPEGFVAAYFRPRKDSVLLRSESGKEYALYSPATGKMLEGIETTREAGQLMKTGWTELAEGEEVEDAELADA